MIVQKIIGGLGNQMFQYAFIKALSLKHNIPFKMDISSYKKTYKLRPFELDVCNISQNYADSTDTPGYEKLHSSNRYISYLYIKLKQFCKMINPHHYYEKNMQYDARFVQIKSGYIEGYFQTELYFKDIEKELKHDLSFLSLPNEINQKYIDQMQETNSISVHVRRGDYLQGKNAHHGICSTSYYQQAIQYMKDHISNPTFYFFSDDPDRIKTNLFSGEKNDQYISHNTKDKSREDMRLMSKCKHNIIANSSFSRRGAWLNDNPNKIVVAPKQWFNDNIRNYTDVIPQSRIKI